MDRLLYYQETRLNLNPTILNALWHTRPIGCSRDTFFQISNDLTEAVSTYLRSKDYAELGHGNTLLFRLKYSGPEVDVDPKDAIGRSYVVEPETATPNAYRELDFVIRVCFFAYNRMFHTGQLLVRPSGRMVGLQVATELPVVDTFLRGPDWRDQLINAIMLMETLCRQRWPQ